MRATPISVLLLALPVAGQAVPATFDARYQPGMTIQSPATGISFSVPDGFAGAWDETVEGIVLTRTDGTVLGIWGASDGTIEEVADVVGEFLTNAGIELAPAASPTSGEVTVAEFHAATDEGRGFLVAALRQGSSGAVFAVAALGTDRAALRTLAETTVRSARFTTPGAQAWAQQAAGVAFTSGGGSSSSSRGGVGDGSYASQTSIRLTLCRSGRYAYEMERESYISVGGVGGAESRSSDAHQGAWSLVGDFMSRGFLVLEADDGREFFWRVEETETGAAIDGTRYDAAQAGC